MRLRPCLLQSKSAPRVSEHAPTRTTHVGPRGLDLLLTCDVCRFSTDIQGLGLIVLVVRESELVGDGSWFLQPRVHV